MSTRFRFIASAALVALAGCQSGTGPDWGWHMEPGLVMDDGFGRLIDLPDTIVGTGWRTLVVQTRGSSSCTRAAGAEIEYANRTVAITPVDSVATRGICTDDLAAHPRNVRVNFSNTGTWTVRIVGRSFDNGAVFETGVVVVDDIPVFRIPSRGS